MASKRVLKTILAQTVFVIKRELFTVKLHKENICLFSYYFPNTAPLVYTYGL